MSNTLAEFPLDYEDLTPTTRKGGKDRKIMAKQSTPSEHRSAKKYNKTRGEHLKDIVIVMLITAILAFVGGLQFASAQQAKVENAVQAVTAEAVATPVKK